MLERHVLFVVLLVGTEAFFSVLAILNVVHGERAVRDNEEWVRDTLGVDDVGALLDYHRAGTGLSVLRSWLALGALLLVLYSGIVTAAVREIRTMGLGPIAGGVVFFLGLLIARQAFSVPFDAMDTFVIEEVFDFNQRSPRLFVRDVLLGTVLGLIVVGALTAALLAAVGWLPARWWIAAVGLFVAFSLAMQVLYPRVIAPLFNDFEPIESDDLREGIEAVFDRAGFACEQIYEMDASKRSSHSNAYFIGFGRAKRVVLFDTLIDRMGLPEIQSVLAHELAHWKRKHVWKTLAAGVVQFGVIVFVLQLLMGTPWLYAMFDLPRTAYAGLFVGGLWVWPFARLLSPLSNRLSIKYEYEADEFAVDINGGEPMVEALSSLTSENLSNPFPHPLYAAFHYTHPPVPDRIQHIRERAGDPTDGAVSPAG